MKRRIDWRPIPLLAAALLATTGFAPLSPSSRSGAEWAGVATDSVVRGTLTDHVIVISIDGLRPDAIEAFQLKALQRIMREGSYSLTAKTVLPSRTLPAHASMLTGRTPEEHGLDFNHISDDHGVVKVPTMFELARARGFSTAAFYSKAKFRHLDRPESYDYRQAPSSGSDKWMATRTIPEAIRYMRHKRPNLLFVHIAETDYAGHVGGWMSFVYKLAARRADAGVARILDAAEETFGAGSFTILVTADHGGHDHDHGSDDPLDTTIPWIVWGQGVVPGQIAEGIQTTDTAATALWLLGVTLPGELDGAPVYAGFREATPTRLADDAS
jgi:arylsulfatase A-like enzyme